jgi:hypothetical protein
MLGNYDGFNMFGALGMPFHSTNARTQRHWARTCGAAVLLAALLGCSGSKDPSPTDGKPAGHDANEDASARTGRDGGPSGSGGDWSSADAGGTGGSGSGATGGSSGGAGGSNSGGTGGDGSGGTGGSDSGSAACGAADPLPTARQGRFPLDELVGGSYMGFAGGLYTDSNQPPCAHRAAGIAAARAIEPLDSSGKPSADGKIVLISIGMSNTTMEFCSQETWKPDMPCAAVSFMGQAAADSEVDHQKLVLVDGAFSAQVAAAWADPANPAFSANYARVTTRLAAANVSEQQVQAVWLKVADPTPLKSLPDKQADAYVLEGYIGDILRELKQHYPHLQLVFGSSRIYGGYATSMLNPEPYAYESGFAVKWAIEAQVSQMAGGSVDSVAGDLDYAAGTAPWYGWGPYLWADGTTPRKSDGLIWESADFDPGDGTHPMPSARQKVGAMLLAHFKTSPLTRCWFLAAAAACE